jgi:hypothetical protein
LRDWRAKHDFNDAPARQAIGKPVRNRDGCAATVAVPRLQD